MKIKAYQIPPEYQTSPLIQFDEIPEGVEIYGNDNYCEHISDLFRNIPAIIDNIDYELKQLQRGEKPHEDFLLILEAYTGRDDYTRAERKQWIDVVRRWTETDEETGVFRDVLRLITGKEHKSATIRGCTQGEWQRIIYPAEYGADFQKFFEIEYFNLGTEWKVKEDDGEEWHIYCLENPRAEIADATGADPSEIELYFFDGWERTPKYKAVEE